MLVKYLWILYKFLFGFCGKSYLLTWKQLICRICLKNKHQHIDIYCYRTEVFTRYRLVLVTELGYSCTRVWKQTRAIRPGDTRKPSTRLDLEYSIPSSILSLNQKLSSNTGSNSRAELKLAFFNVRMTITGKLLFFFDSRPSITISELEFDLSTGIWLKQAWFEYQNLVQAVAEFYYLDEYPSSKISDFHNTSIN